MNKIVTVHDLLFLAIHDVEELNTLPNFVIFLKENNYTVEELQKKKLVTKLQEDQLKILINKRQKLVFYDNSDLRRNILIALSVIFALLYLIRPLVGLIRGMIFEVKY